MKNIRKFLLLVLVSLAAVSCDDYFDVNFDDQANLEDIFSQKVFTRRYLSQVYGYIPRDEHFVYGSGFVVPRSDEALFAAYRWLPSIPYRTGNYGPSTSQDWTNYGIDLWDDLYIGINQATIFMNHVDLDKEDSEQLREIMKAEARFLRAYYYFCLFRQFGPVYIWGDNDPDEAIRGTDVDRMSVDENIDFIVSELDKAIEVLPLSMEEIGESTDQWMGRATKGAAMAVKARVLLYAASPLFNGCDLYKDVINKDGVHLFPTEPDPTKWDKAAAAAKAVIDLDQYSLVEKDSETSPLLNAIKSVQAVRFEAWNDETIWGWWKRVGSSAYDWAGASATNIMYSLPSNVCLYGYSNFSPSLRLVDTYPMITTGRYPVKGYQKDANNYNDLSKPIVDPLSGYQTTGFRENYQQPDTEHWAPAIKAHNTTVDRDARFYADVVPDGFWWPNKNPYNGSTHKFTCWDDDVDPVNGPEIKFSPTGDIVRAGYVYRKDYPTDKLLVTGGDYTSIKFVFPAFRLAEIYLAYAEACNEKPERNEEEAFKYLNKVRNRAGLNNIEEAYPEIVGNQELLRWCIQREKMVEFAFEAHRHYDACRWMIAKDEYPCENWTLSLSSKNYEGVYERTKEEFVLDPTVFEDKDYLFPLSTEQITNMTNITQNYGF